MKISAHYSETKFKSFTFEEQIGALNKLILSLEKNLTDTEKRSQIIEHILELYLLVEKPLF